MVLSTRRRRDRDSKMLKEGKQLLVDIPLDVLFEIFHFLDPADLLRLARTSKVLREFLLDRRKASALWKNVISNINGFPPCPDHMSPPAYTFLAFVPVCHRCLRPCETVEWELRMRCCSDCFPTMTISPHSINKTSTYLSALRLPKAYWHYKLYEGSLDVSVYQEYIPSGSSVSKLDWKVVESRKRPRNVSTEEFVLQQNEYWGSIIAHADLCRVWEHGRLEERAIQMSFVRKQRVQDIKDRLKKLRWTNDIWSSSREYHFLWLPEVRKLEPLTPVEWIKMRPGLVSWARSARRALIRDLRVATFTSVSLGIQRDINDDTSLKVKPRGIDIAMLPTSRSVLENDNLASESAFNSISDNLEKKLLRVLPPAIRKWSSDAVKELENLAREQYGLLPQSKPSSLPSVIFRCKKCSRSVKRHLRFTFGEALSHDHLYRDKKPSGTGQDEMTMTPYDKLLTKYSTHPRNIQVLQVDLTISRRVENLIKRMGQNPSSATHAGLRCSTIKVACGLCGPENAARMDFESAFVHCLDSHIGNKETEVWTRVSARKENTGIPPM